jgi:hypothetical protein
LTTHDVTPRFSEMHLSLVRTRQRDRIPGRLSGTIEP